MPGIFGSSSNPSPRDLGTLYAIPLFWRLSAMVTRDLGDGGGGPGRSLRTVSRSRLPMARDWRASLAVDGPPLVGGPVTEGADRFAVALEPAVFLDIKSQYTLIYS